MAPFLHRLCSIFSFLGLLLLSVGFLTGKEEVKILSEIKLQADLKSGKKGVPQVQAAFGKYSIETPVTYIGKEQDFKHLTVSTATRMETGTRYGPRVRKGSATRSRAIKVPPKP